MAQALDSLQSKTFASRTLFISVLFASIFAALSVLATIYALKQIKNQTLEDYGSALEVVLDTSENGLIQWVSRRQNSISQISNSNIIQRLNIDEIQQQTAPGKEPISETISRIKDELRLLQDIKGNQGFIIFATNGQVVLSTASQLRIDAVNISTSHFNDHHTY